MTTLTDVSDLAEYLTRKSTAPVYALVLSRGTSLGGGSVFEVLKQAELKGRTHEELGAALHRAAHRDATAARSGGAYSVWVQRSEEDTALLERFTFAIDLPVRSTDDERTTMLTVARELNEGQSRTLLEFAREIARKNQAEMDRLTAAAAAADARAVEMAGHYFGGVTTFANAALLNEERAAKLRAEKRSETMLQTALSLGDFLLPTLASGVLRRAGVDGTDPAATPQWKDMQTLRAVDPAKFSQISSVLDPLVQAAFGAILGGDVLAEFVPVAVARAMGHVTEEQAAAIVQILGPANVAADGTATPNAAQLAFSNLWRSRFFTLSAQADAAVKKMAEGSAGAAMKALVTGAATT